MPKFRIKNFVERARWECVRLSEANHVPSEIARHIIPVADFLQAARGKRFINFLARLRRQIRQLPVCHSIIHSPNFLVERVVPEIHEADPVILQLRRRNQRIVWRNGLLGICDIEIGAKDDLVPITIQRGVKCRVTVVGGVKKQIKYDKAGTCPK